MEIDNICLISPIEQNKTVIAWDGKPHKRYFELEAIEMVKYWRKNGGWLKDIDIFFFNVNSAKISKVTVEKLYSLGCKIINSSEKNNEYQDIGFLTEPLCGKIAEQVLDNSKKILIKIDLDMKLIKPLKKELIELAYDNILIEEYTDYDKKGQRLQIGKSNPLDTCFMVSNRESNFYNYYYQMCFNELVLNSEQWKKIYSETKMYFIEEFVVDYIKEHNLGPQQIMSISGHIFGESYMPISMLTDEQVMNLNFLHSHIYLNEKSPDDEFDIKNIWKEYLKRMCSCYLSVQNKQ